jgi:glutamyl-tRNA synthetase
MNIKTRFAPSPTGVLHIGGARTAIFNWLFAKKNKGDFYLRVEDTDLKRSRNEHVSGIKDGLKWLGLEWSGDTFFQSKNIKRHVEIADLLISKGKAYHCYATTEEMQAFKENNPGKKFISKWRDAEYTRSKDQKNKPVVRLKVYNEGVSKIQDLVLGSVEVRHSDIDDMVLLRSDGTPTYLLSSVVDDYDMGITHVIRGNDHLSNTFRQLQILNALSWSTPFYAHIPLIHGSDGNKLSKRDGALGIEEYKNDGYLPEALFNYLLRLGWSHKDVEIISVKEVIQIFDLADINKSPAKFDMNKLRHLNQHYIQAQEDGLLFDYIISKHGDLNDTQKLKIKKSVPLIKSRGETLNDIQQLAEVFISKIDPIDKKSKEILAQEESSKLLAELYKLLQSWEDWTAEALNIICTKFAEKHGLKPAVIMKLLRATVLGTFKSPPIYSSMCIISKDEVLKRILETLS